MLIAQPLLFVGRSNANNLSSPFRQLHHHTLAGAPKQDRLQEFSQRIEVFVTGNAPIFVDRSVPMKESVSGT